jgi:hypothetical protein
MRRGGRLVFTAWAASCLIGMLASAPARADHAQLSIFQDDEHLIYTSPAGANATLGVLKSLGVQVVRVTVEWADVAPDPGSRARPAFNAIDPASYPAGAWTRYDDLVLLAAHYGIGVQFTITAPGPLWAMQPDSPTRRAADHYEPDPQEFAEFVYAVGRRYSGTYSGLPRVGIWSIWNEPNQGGWLAPQWSKRNKAQVPTSASLYRRLLEAGYLALAYSGHVVGKDTILIGELAPEGSSSRGFYEPMTPMVFLRALYCVDTSYKRLRGASAGALGCPQSGSAHSFVAANPALFDATGFAHHPYDFFLAPGVRSPDPNFVPLANLSRLEHGLNRAFATYGVRRRIPIYLTEYGYQTNPPDPFQRVTPAEQAVYLNHADYMAWSDPRVRSVAQFLLLDSGPDTRYPPSSFSYWDLFQTGLAFTGGSPKPAYFAYRMPIWIPQPDTRRGARALVWGQLRAAPHASPQQAYIQWRPRGGAYRNIAIVTTGNPDGYLTARVKIPGSGFLRIAWISGSGAVLVSRGAAVSVS